MISLQAEALKVLMPCGHLCVCEAPVCMLQMHCAGALRYFFLKSLKPCMVEGRRLSEQSPAEQA